MGGPGSGRWYRWDTKRTIEGHPSLDVRAWQREQLLRPGMSFLTHWSDARGKRLASISVQVQHGQVLLSYRRRRTREAWQEVEEPVALTWTACHYGGQRPWFICPGG